MCSLYFCAEVSGASLLKEEIDKQEFTCVEEASPPCRGCCRNFLNMMLTKPRPCHTIRATKPAVIISSQQRQGPEQRRQHLSSDPSRPQLACCSWPVSFAWSCRRQEGRIPPLAGGQGICFLSSVPLPSLASWLQANRPPPLHSSPI